MHGPVLRTYLVIAQAPSPSPRWRGGSVLAPTLAPSPFTYLMPTPTATALCYYCCTPVQLCKDTVELLLASPNPFPPTSPALTGLLVSQLPGSTLPASSAQKGTQHDEPSRNGLSGARSRPGGSFPLQGRLPHGDSPGWFGVSRGANAKIPLSYRRLCAVNGVHLTPIGSDFFF